MALDPALGTRLDPVEEVQRVVGAEAVRLCVSMATLRPQLVSTRVSTLPKSREVRVAGLEAPAVEAPVVGGDF